MGQRKTLLGDCHPPPPLLSSTSSPSSMGVNCLHVSSWYTSLMSRHRCQKRSKGSKLNPNLILKLFTVCVSVSVVHVRGERLVVLLVLPVIGVALIIRLLRRPLTSPDDWQTAVAWVRAASEQNVHTDRNKENSHKHTWPTTGRQRDGQQTQKEAAD